MSSLDQFDLATLEFAEDADVFTARQLAREVAGSAGLDRLDATRVATAISELAREAIASGGGSVTFAVRENGEFLAVVRATGGLAAHDESIRAAERLVDRLLHEAHPGGGSTVVLTKVPTATTAFAPADVHAMRDRVAGLHQRSPTEELRQQHDELLAALGTLRVQNTQLEVLNRELEETNRGVVALYAEIDDKNSQLTAASDAKSRFLRSISHELRTPANSVLGLTRLLTDRGAEPLTTDQREQVEFIRTSATDLLDLVNELLDLAKAESGRLEPQPRTVLVDDFLTELRNMTVPLLRPGVELSVTGGDTAATVHTDPDLVRHVLRNLLSNAAKFTERGTVELAFEQRPDGPTFGVTDTGVGLAQEDLTRVFEEFFQARSSLHATAKGTGLGLPFARRVATALGGRIDVSSVLGAGSQFVLRLPDRTPEAEPAP